MKVFFLYLMIVFYAVAGVYHFIKPQVYLKIMPPYLPNPLLLVQVSGVCETLFALLLIPESTRPLGAWLLIALLLAIFPANIQMAVNFSKANDPNLWIAIVRLPLQIALIWWAWIYTKG